MDSEQRVANEDLSFLGSGGSRGGHLFRKGDLNREELASVDVQLEDHGGRRGREVGQERRGRHLQPSHGREEQPVESAHILCYYKPVFICLLGLVFFLSFY